MTFLNRESEAFPDIGFAMLPEFERKGYAFEASKAYLEKVLESNTYDNILDITLVHNTKSIKLLKNLGLTHQGDRTKEEVLSYYSLNKGIFDN